MGLLASLSSGKPPALKKSEERLRPAANPQKRGYLEKREPPKAIAERSLASAALFAPAGRRPCLLSKRKVTLEVGPSLPRSPSTQFSIRVFPGPGGAPRSFNPRHKEPSPCSFLTSPQLVAEFPDVPSSVLLLEPRRWPACRS